MTLKELKELKNAVLEEIAMAQKWVEWNAEDTIDCLKRIEDLDCAVSKIFEWYEEQEEASDETRN